MLGLKELKQTKFYQEAHAEGRGEGQLDLILRQLKRRFGLLDIQMETQLRSLNLDQLAELGEALLDFANPEDLQAWLKQEESKF
jgi:predicted transposase YdaD